jgi:hypothetical protein
MTHINKVLSELKNNNLSDYAERIEVIIAEGGTEPVFTFTDDDKKKIQESINAPYVHVQKSSLGGSDRSSIYIKLSLDEKKDWANGIYENSDNMMFGVHYDGRMELMTYHYKSSEKFKKTLVKTVDEIISKINSHIKLVQDTNVDPIDTDNEEVVDKIITSLKSVSGVNNVKKQFNIPGGVFIQVDLSDNPSIAFYISKKGKIEFSGRSKKVAKKPFRAITVKNADEAIKKITDYLIIVKEA